MRILNPVLVAVGLAIVAAPAQAEVPIFFKDGFTLSGVVAREGETITDAGSGQSFTVRKGAFFVIDGARRISFSFSQVGAVGKNVVVTADIVRLGTRISRLNADPLDPIIQIIGASPWTEKWERKFTINVIRFGKLRPIDVQQRMTMLTPQYARVDALRYNWAGFYATSELEPETVRMLLLSHVDLKDKAKGFAGGLHVARFFTQAGWYDQANHDIKDLLKDFPAEKEKLEQLREHLLGLTTIRNVEEMERAHQAGRYRWLKEQAEAFPRDGADPKLLARVLTFGPELEANEESLQRAQRYLKELVTKIEAPAEKKLFSTSVAVILEELDLDNVERLTTFLDFAKQSERDVSQGRPASRNPAQLLSLAISGWLLGKQSAEAKVDVAHRLWNSRQFVLEYLNNRDSEDRERMVKSYLGRKGSDKLAVDEMAQLLTHLPPSQPEKDTSTDTKKFEAPLSWNRKKTIPYLLELPMEYHHGRAYPVLIALRNAGETPEAMLKRCSMDAAKNGFILAVPSWGGELPDVYRYSREEHAAVVDVLRDVKRRYQVDSDRVFVMGYGEGGAMAYDVGLSHPDLFAGVLPVSAVLPPVNGSPQFVVRYRNNGQHLPFYCVSGDHAGEISKQNHEFVEKMLPWGYPVLGIEYKGRGLEWFEPEVPPMFDWMSRKRRATAFGDLGRQEFQTMRETDNRFYWLSTDSIKEGNLNEARNWKNSITAATMHARIGEGNQINITAKGLNEVTLWLGRDAKGHDMIDFTKPVTIRLNGAVMRNQERIQPSLTTLLEDYYERGDRQRLFLAREKMKLR